MKFSIKNLGIVDEANLTLGDLTLICGENNTGKTYITYAIYGFLKYLLRQDDRFYYRYNPNGFVISRKQIQDAYKSRESKISIKSILDRLKTLLPNIAENYKEDLPHIFGSSREFFEKVEFKIEDLELQLPTEFKKKWRFPKDIEVIIERDQAKDKDCFSIRFFNLPKDSDEGYVVRQAYHWINYYLFKLSVSEIFKNIFIASTERTGAAIFQNELNFARNRLLEKINELDRKNENSMNFFRKQYKDYALPVKDNVDFIRDLNSYNKEKSYLKTDYPDILTHFSKKLLKGKYQLDKVTKAIQFIPNKKKNKTKVTLSMDESSSTVRSLLDIHFYLHHIAQKGDILLIDEPELNLHPENQRLMARLLAQLINSGLKVFVTTHSDYLVKELSLLILLKNKTKIAQAEKYQENELLEPHQLKIYMTKEEKGKITLKSAKIDNEEGIDLESFNKTISEMNRIGDRILCEED